MSRIISQGEPSEPKQRFSPSRILLVVVARKRQPSFGHFLLEKPERPGAQTQAKVLSTCMEAMGMDEAIQGDVSGEGGRRTKCETPKGA